MKRFRREAETAARLEHPGIVPIHEVSERDGSCYFSMQFIEGGQLDEVARRTPIPIRRATELIAKVARTVHYAHEHEILHRDIKPGNILLDQKGEPHLTDFGLARLVETESTVTHTLEVLGAPSYMAPEQAVANNVELTSATDVYGLGAVFYQLLTGHPSFAGGTTYETIRLLLNTEPRQPRQLNPKIDRDLSTICLKCLDIDEQSPNGLAFETKTVQLRLERNYSEAIRLLQARLTQFHSDSDYEKAGNQMRLALMKHLVGDTAGARITAEQARSIFEQLSREQPQNSLVAAMLSDAPKTLRGKAAVIHHSLKSPLCWCVWVTLPASS